MKMIVRRRLAQPLPLDAPQPLTPAPAVPQPTQRAPQPRIPQATEPAAVAQRQWSPYARGSTLPPQRRHPADKGGPWSPPQLGPVQPFPEWTGTSASLSAPGSPGAEPGHARALNEPVTSTAPKSASDPGTDIVGSIFGPNYDDPGLAAPPTRADVLKARRARRGPP